MKFPHSQVYSFAFDSICFDVDLCPRKQTQGGHESICMISAHPGAFTFGLTAALNSPETI